MKEKRCEESSPPPALVRHSISPTEPPPIPSKDGTFGASDHDYFLQPPRRVIDVIELDSDEESSEGSTDDQNGVLEDSVSPRSPSPHQPKTVNGDHQPAEESPKQQTELSLLQNGISIPPENDHDPVASTSKANCNGLSNQYPNSQGLDLDETNSIESVEREIELEDDPKSSVASPSQPATNDELVDKPVLDCSSSETTTGSSTPEPVPQTIPRVDAPYHASAKSFLNFLSEKNVPRASGPRKMRMLPTLEEMLNTTLKLSKLQERGGDDMVVASSEASQAKASYVSKMSQSLVSKMTKEFPAKVEKLYNFNKYKTLEESELHTLKLGENEGFVEAPSQTCQFLKFEEKPYAKKLHKGKLQNPMAIPIEQVTGLHQVLLRDVGTNEAHRWLHRENVVNRRLLSARKSSPPFSFRINTTAAINEESEDKVKKAVKRQLSLLYTSYKYYCLMCSFSSHDPPVILDHIETVHITNGLIKVNLSCPLCSRKFASSNYLKQHVPCCARVDEQGLKPMADVLPCITMKPITKAIQDAISNGSIRVHQPKVTSNRPTIIHTTLPSLHPRIPKPFTPQVTQVIPKRPATSMPLTYTVPPSTMPYSSPTANVLQPILANGPSLKRRKLNSEMADHQFICELCYCHVGSFKDYGLHLERKHKVFLPQHKLEDPLFRCNHCLQVSCTPEGYERHFVFRHGICYRPHNPEDSGTCGICFKVVRSNLKQHLERDHRMELQDSELIFKCKVCNELFNKHCAYERHYTSMHAATST